MRQRFCHIEFLRTFAAYYMKLKIIHTALCARTIAAILIALLPWCASSQHGNSTFSPEGNVSLEMVVVPAGTFSMGCTFEQAEHCAYDEKPEHQVSLKGFAIAKYEVTQKLWKEIMGTNPSRVVGDELPVHNVSWDEVQIFILWLNQKTGMNYRLPTEAEWEYAARGGSRQGEFPFTYSGGNDLATVAWYYDNSGGAPHTVGTKRSNALGLYDMSGNVWEWCSDLYGMYSEQAQQNPAGAMEGIARVARGGGAGGRALQCRVTARKSMYQGGNDEFTGFRLAVDYDAPPNIDTVRKAAPKPPTSDKTPAADTVKASLRALLAAEKAADRQQRADSRQARLDTLPPSVFFTLNASYLSMPQWSYGFKVGTMRVVGWYFSFMTNFQYKGAFSSFQPNQHYVLTGASKTTYLGGEVGLVVRPCRLLSIHIGAGFGYRALKFESDQGWHSYPKRTYYGPTAAAGLMFHVKNIALSAEATGMAYNLNPLNEMHYALGVRLGVGFCIPYKN